MINVVRTAEDRFTHLPEFAYTPGDLDGIIDLIQRLELRYITAVVRDWGGLLGFAPSCRAGYQNPHRTADRDEHRDRGRRALRPRL